MLARLFARPGIWLALAILLLNDHVGKRLASQGVVPGALTGKLSDVAGLAFAPALAWALARVLGRSRGWAWSAFWLVPLVFTVLNLSSSACSAWTSFFAWFGLEQVIWSDPSDLLALPAVGLGYRWVRQSEQRSEPCGPRWRAFAGVGLGGFACLATSTPWSTSTLPAPSLRNATGVELTIALQHTLVPVGCERIPLAPGDFAAAQFHALDDGEHVTLDEAHRSQDTGAAGESGAPSFGGGDCGAVTITAAKLAPTIVRWDLRDVSSPPNLDAAEDVAPGTVYVEQFGSELHLALGDGMSATPLEAPP